MNLKKRRAFTLIELLTVIAIIGILAAIIIPTTGAVRNSAKKAKGRIQFQNWIGAMEGFKQEYGYFPRVDITSPSSTTKTYLVKSAAFAAALTGRELDGDRITVVDDRYGNKKERSFYSLSTDDLSADKTKLLDSFGNEQIAVLFDRNGDGLIKIGTAAGDDGELPEVHVGSPAATSGGLKPTNDSATAHIPSTGLRASVIFYSAGAGGGTKDMIMSWK